MTSALAQLRGRQVTIVEVGPRDGLQNESVRLSTADKVTFVDALTNAGLPVIEVAAFVHPTRVPQMADASEVCLGLTRRPGTRYVALVPNLQGLERAVEAGLTEVAIFAAASESFSRANIKASIDQSLDTYASVCRRAQSYGVRVRGYLSTAFGCPFEGEVAPQTVMTLAERLLDLGVFEVAVSDTIGVAHPGQVSAVLDVLETRIPLARLALHFHDTRGTALANVLVGLEHGVTTFDASAGGLGGCPFAPGASGNLATEDLVYMLNGLGIRTNVDLDQLVAASSFIGERIDHPLPSRFLTARRASRLGL